MANDVTSNPWNLDTPSTSVVVWPSRINVEHFEMINYLADGDTVQIKDITGRIVWEGNGENDLSPVRSGKVGWVNGLVFSLSSQPATRVRVYIK